MKNHLPVKVVWDEVATVLDTGLTGLRKNTTIKYMSSLSLPHGT